MAIFDGFPVETKGYQYAPLIPQYIARALHTQPGIMKIAKRAVWANPHAVFSLCVQIVAKEDRQNDKNLTEIYSSNLEVKKNFIAVIGSVMETKRRVRAVTDLFKYYDSTLLGSSLRSIPGKTCGHAMPGYLAEISMTSALFQINLTAPKNPALTKRRFYIIWVPKAR